MSDSSDENKSRLPSYIAYSVEEGSNDKNHWHKIGAAWPTKEGGLSLQLNALPINGRIALRSREELERMRAERQQALKQNQAQDINYTQ